MPVPVIIRKSLISYVSSFVMAAICLLAICFAIFSAAALFLKIASSLVLLLFIISTIKKAVQRKADITLTDEGITLIENELIRWSEIKDVFLDTRNLVIAVRGGRTKLTYLNIEPIFSGQFSKQRVIKSVVVSDMDMPPAIILHHIRAFRQWYNLSTPTFAAINTLPNEPEI